MDSPEELVFGTPGLIQALEVNPVTNPGEASRDLDFSVSEPQIILRSVGLPSGLSPGESLYPSSPKIIKRAFFSHDQQYSRWSPWATMPRPDVFFLPGLFSCLFLSRCLWESPFQATFFAVGFL